MDASYAQSIADEIVSQNFSRASALAAHYIKELPASNGATKSAEHIQADEAFEITRYLLHRSERLNIMPQGMEKGRAFLEILDELTVNGEYSTVRRAAIMLCHAQIADNFARDLAGQKSYQLQIKDLLQLAYSLLIIANYPSAKDVLGFVLANHSTHAGAHYLAAHAANMTGDEQNFFEHYREALYLRPEVVSEYPEFMPGGIFRDLMQLVREEGYSGTEQNSTKGIRERIYALLLEVNGVYRYRRKLKVDEARQVESEFNRLKQEYISAREHKKAFEPRLLQLLAMLIIHAHQTQNYEKFEAFRGEMTAIDHAVWQAFQQNNFSQGNSP
ncbi:MAG: hypothetical protein LDLANPLL_01112 [Turneriella sp.]|nr:hypothetical protein [Turneriella sp.]